MRSAVHSELERVREASDIVDIIGERVSLRPRGREYVGLCPFHDDHRPSMYVVPHKQIFHCFACGAGGDVLTFVRRFHGMDFREALEHLAARAGIELAPAAPDRPAEGTSRAELVRANAAACRFFQRLLRHDQHGRAGRQFLQSRGLTGPIVDAFGLGVSPDQWDGLAQWIARRGLDPGPFLHAGLLKPRSDGSGWYDAFRHRLMFPIADLAGRVIAFGGRRLRDDDSAKYINSRESALFAKSGVLYGLSQASRSIQREGVAIVTEGYTDVLACHRAGITNVVGVLGTALTAEHARVLRRLCDTVVLLFDLDQSGQDAADRAIRVFFAESIDVRVAMLSARTGAKDPDELLRRDDGVDTLRQAVTDAIDLLEYRFGRLRERVRGAGVSAIQHAVESELEQLVALGLNRVPLLRRRLIVQRLAALAGVDESTIVRVIPLARGGRQSEPTRPRPPDPIRSALEAFLGCTLCDGRVWLTLDEADRTRVCTAAQAYPPLAELVEAISRVASRGCAPELAAVIAELGPSESGELAVALERRVDRATDATAARWHAHAADCLARIRYHDAVHRRDPSPDAQAELIRRRRDMERELGPIGPNRALIPRAVARRRTGP